MSVPSDTGGGLYGHLGAVMPAAKYLALPGAVAYNVPIHPGEQAPTAANATAIQISQANQAYDKALERFTTHNNVVVALKQLILAAVDDRYVSTLQHHRLRYAQVTVEALLAHLNNTYSEITPEVLEQNRSNIMAEWNPDDGIEMIFTCITAAHQFAEAAGAANVISEATAIYLALTAIENTGVFIEPCSDWRKHPAGEQSLANFVFDFTHAWKERDHCIIAKTAGYQALLTTHTDDKENKSPPALPSKNKPDIVIDTVEMFYCWSHGLGFNPKHTSHTCNTKKDGHKDDATIHNRKGGSTTIWESNCKK